MKNEQLRKQHIRSFAKLSLAERLSWAFAHNQFLSSFRDSKDKYRSKKIRRKGKRYFENSNLA